MLADNLGACAFGEIQHGPFSKLRGADAIMGVWRASIWAVWRFKGVVVLVTKIELFRSSRWRFWRAAKRGAYRILCRASVKVVFSVRLQVSFRNVELCLKKNIQQYHPMCVLVLCSDWGLVLRLRFRPTNINFVLYSH